MLVDCVLHYARNIFASFVCVHARAFAPNARRHAARPKTQDGGHAQRSHWQRHKTLRMLRRRRERVCVCVFVCSRMRSSVSLTSELHTHGHADMSADKHLDRCADGRSQRRSRWLSLPPPLSSATSRNGDELRSSDTFVQQSIT